eukprot:33415-Amphidinium_carterae.1
MGFTKVTETIGWGIITVTMNQMTRQQTQQDSKTAWVYPEAEADSELERKRMKRNTPDEGHDGWINSHPRKWEGQQQNVGILRIFWKETEQSQLSLCA